MARRLRKRRKRKRKAKASKPDYLGGRKAISFTGRSIIIIRYAPPNFQSFIITSKIKKCKVHHICTPIFLNPSITNITGTKHHIIFIMSLKS